ncbi:hypothetical protein [Pedobacter aquatilis]|uniref:hypothetical protein n=1 Tax=Pedobacter aquatilis TaxID=351343 RepID=UPI00292D99C8|nr:hypothetical protein [Pedobacter aquatilis]
MIFAQKVITNEQKIINEEINPLIYTDTSLKQPLSVEPNWKKLQKSISKKYKDIDAVKVINGSKIRFYKIKNNWDQFADAYLTNLEKYEQVNKMVSHRQLSWSVNNTLYSIFKNVSKKKLLLRSATQSRKIVDNPNSVKPGEPSEQYSANNIDTYANLLYKAGNLKQAIKWQKKAVRYTNGNEKEFNANLKKMQKGERTW